MSDIVYTLKLVIMGDEGVGKSSLIVRFVENKFSAEYISTIGVDFLVKETKLENNNKAKLVIWDIGGQEQWKAKLNLYLKGADGGVVICDLTRPASGKSVTSWVEALKKHAGEVPYIVVGNKVDLKRKISKKDFNEIEKGHLHFESSAKTGEVVEQFFKEIASQMIQKKKG
ncbi:MAG: GTP-binding protein [Candidatus Lokiarchaeota archaeon]|nr:GTP-binding protein [Candidatus Lokiarchaeota archaeon]